MSAIGDKASEEHLPEEETMAAEEQKDADDQWVDPEEFLSSEFDPDVAAALEGYVESADELEDNFVELAGGEEAVNDDEKSGREEMMRRFGLIRKPKGHFSDEDDDDEEDLVAEDEGVHRDNKKWREDAISLGTAQDDRKSRFTNYSMSSAVIRRPDGLRQIDDHFESLYESQYGEEQEGQGDTEDEADGTANSSCIDPNNSTRFRELLEENKRMEQRFQREQPDPELKEAVLRYAEVNDEETEREETERILVPGAKRSRWDCESILSTYSTLYNHPTVIREPGNKRKRNSGLTKGGLNKMENMDVDQPAAECGTESVRSSRVSNASTFRPKGETPEQRRQRKQAVKEERRERRQEKKSNRMAFREQKLAMDGSTRRKDRPIH